MCYYCNMDTTQRTTLESQIEELERLVAELTATIERQAATIAKQKELNEYYLEQLRLARRHRFGRSSEQLDSDEFRQITLFNEVEAEADKTLPEPEIEQITYKRKKQVGKREKDLADLPVERIDYELPEDQRFCPECGGPMEDIGVTIRRELQIIPAQVVVVEHATHAYKCQDDCAQAGSKAIEVQSRNKTENDAAEDQVVDAGETPEVTEKAPVVVESTPEAAEEAPDVKSTIVRAESPAPLISGSLASPSAVAYVIDQKYGLGMPLYRIETDLKYKGINLSRQTISNWIIYCAETFLSGIYALLITYLLMEFVLHADETTLQVLHEKGKAATSKSYEWIYRTSGFASHRIVIYEYQPSRDGKHPKKFLKDYIGFLQTDGYQAYHNLPGIIVVGCWAHARRYWENLYNTLPKDTRANSDAARGLKYIGALFKFEREFASLSPAERYRMRLEKSKPVADAFFAWIATLGALPQSLLGKAVGYAQSQREYLMNVFLDGRLELSNNRAERSVKTFVMGRKAWLFSNTPNGAEASSIMFSIVETARENGLKPYEYVKYLLEKLPSAKTSELETFLPWSESIPDYCRVPVKPDPEKHAKTRSA